MVQSESVQSLEVVIIVTISVTLRLPCVLRCVYLMLKREFNLRVLSFILPCAYPYVLPCILSCVSSFSVSFANMLTFYFTLQFSLHHIISIVPSCVLPVRLLFRLDLSCVYGLTTPLSGAAGSLYRDVTAAPDSLPAEGLLVVSHEQRNSM